jgi:hypothetical protein
MNLLDVKAVIATIERNPGAGRACCGQPSV